MRHWFRWLALALVLVGGGWQGAAWAAKDIRVGGTTALMPLLRQEADAFMRKNPDVRVLLDATDSTQGIQELIQGNLELAASGRELTQAETTAMDDRGLPPTTLLVALDGLVPVVHPDNPVEGLTLGELADIYRGRIKSWADVGGPDKPIVVVSRSLPGATRELWDQVVLDQGRLRLDAQELPSDQEVARTVGRNPYALGYLGRGFLEQGVKALTVDGMAAGEATLRDHSYPLGRGLYLFSRGEPLGMVKEFLDFIASPAGMDLVVEAGLIPAP